MKVKGFASRPAAEDSKDGGFLICRRPTLDLHKEKHRLAAKRLMLQANAGAIRLIPAQLQLVVLKNQNATFKDRNP